MNRLPADHIDAVMPAYNAEPWIAEAVRSVLGVPAVRSLTVVDDGSGVSMARALGGLAGDPRVTVLRRPNGGESAARNTGIEHLLSTTDPCGDALAWVMFVDADDVLLPSCVAALSDAQRAGAAACVAARESFWADGRTERLDPPGDLRNALFATPSDAFRFQHVFASTGMAVRRTVLRDGERWDELIRIGPDIEFLHRVGKRGPVWVSAVPVLSYRRHEDGRNLSGYRHYRGRIRGFIRIVELHATESNDSLLRDQADWLLNQQSKHGRPGDREDRAAFEDLMDLYRGRGWRRPIKPRLRHAVRTVIA